MTTNIISYNTSLSIAAPSNDNTITKLLVVDNNNNIKYRNTSTISANQSLNTTDNVLFNSVTTGMISSTATNNALIFPGTSTNSIYLYASGTTTDATATTIFTYPTATNNNYLIYAEVASKDTVSGGGAYLQTKMVTNTAGTINNVIQLENISNKSTAISTSSILITSSGTNIILQVTGVSGRTINWKALIRLVVSTFV
jgi:hypothetical protein